MERFKVFQEYLLLLALGYLHSNMERFKERKNEFMSSYLNNLHSNMERFKGRDGVGSLLDFGTFTFQYGEI